jgi:hypothetical protein
MRQKRPRTHTPATVWAKVKADYLLGTHSCAQLAKQYKLKECAVLARCSREGWRKELNATKEKFDAITLKHRQNRDKLGPEEFLKRSEQDIFDWLDKISLERERLQPGDVESLKGLINSWRTPVELGRKTYKLDEQGNEVKQVIGLFFKGSPYAQPPQHPQDPKPSPPPVPTPDPIDIESSTS